MAEPFCVLCMDLTWEAWLGGTRVDTAVATTPSEAGPGEDKYREHRRLGVTLSKQPLENYPCALDHTTPLVKTGE